MKYKQRIDYTAKQLEFQKLKKRVRRLCPDAKSESTFDGSFTVLNRDNLSIIREDHFMPPARTVQHAWEQAAVCAHADRVIAGNGKAFKASKKASELTAAMEGFLDDSSVHDGCDEFNINN